MRIKEDIISTNDARVASIDLDVGECSTWHYHTEVTENVICLSGTIEVQYDRPKNSFVVMPGLRNTISARVIHRLINRGDRIASYLLIQSGQYDFIECDIQI